MNQMVTINSGVKKESNEPVNSLDNEDKSGYTDFTEESSKSETRASTSQSCEGTCSQQPEEVVKIVDKIASINLNSTSFIARVAFKSRRMPYESGKRFCVDFVDETGRIFAVIFNRDGNELYKPLMDGQVYKIENFEVQHATEFSTTGHPFDLVLSNVTSVVELNDDPTIPRYRFIFRTLPAIRNVEIGTRVDIIAFYDGRMEVNYPIVDGKSMARLDVQLTDSLRNNIVVTFWGNNAESFEPEIEPGMMVAIRGAKVKDYYKPRNLSFGKNAFKLTFVDIPVATTFLASLGLSAESLNVASP